jgi:hypothetical protein
MRHFKIKMRHSIGNSYQKRTINIGNEILFLGKIFLFLFENHQGMYRKSFYLPEEDDVGKYTPEELEATWHAGGI